MPRKYWLCEDDISTRALLEEEEERKKKLQCENTKRVTVFRCRRKNWMKLILFRLWSEPNGYDVTTAPHKLTHSVCALNSTDEMSISVCCFWSSELCIVCEYERREKNPCYQCQCCRCSSVHYVFMYSHICLFSL